MVAVLRLPVVARCRIPVALVACIHVPVLPFVVPFVAVGYSCGYVQRYTLVTLRLVTVCRLRSRSRRLRLQLPFTVTGYTFPFTLVTRFIYTHGHVCLILHTRPSLPLRYAFCSSLLVTLPVYHVYVYDLYVRCVCCVLTRTHVVVGYVVTVYVYPRLITRSHTRLLRSLRYHVTRVVTLVVYVDWLLHSRLLVTFTVTVDLRCCSVVVARLRVVTCVLRYLYGSTHVYLYAVGYV